MQILGSLFNIIVKDIFVATTIFYQKYSYVFASSTVFAILLSTYADAIYFRISPIHVSHFVNFLGVVLNCFYVYLALVKGLSTSGKFDMEYFRKFCEPKFEIIAVSRP